MRYYPWIGWIDDPPEPEEKEETLPTHMKSECPRCGAPAYVSLLFVECSKECTK